MLRTTYTQKLRNSRWPSKPAYNTKRKLVNTNETETMKTYERKMDIGAKSQNLSTVYSEDFLALTCTLHKEHYICSAFTCYTAKMHVSHL